MVGIAATGSGGRPTKIDCRGSGWLGYRIRDSKTFSHSLDPPTLVIEDLVDLAKPVYGR